ncbi:MAG: LTA synthase family protein, partial [Flavobacteriaceae bacterium]
MKLKFFPERFLLLKRFIITYILFSTVIRFVFLIWNFSEVDTSIINLGSTFIYGFLYDIGTVSYFAVPFSLYLLFSPKRYYGTLIDRVITYFGYTLGLLIFLFSFFAEVTFWEEFKRRFNFIAVDYLIYTGEVVNNINESYPLPIFISIMLLVVALLVFTTNKRLVFKKVFLATTTFKEKLSPTLLFITISLVFTLFVSNKGAEFSENRYNNEIAKTGIYSFFAAFRNNELSYTEFYATLNNSKAFNNLKEKCKKKGDSLFFENENAIFRKIKNIDSLPELKPNVIFICVESFSAIFLDRFGDIEMDIPTLDSLVD